MVRNIDPIFILFLDAVAQLVRMNPLAFEFMSSYPAFIASEIHTNRFFEFIQGEDSDKDKNLVGLKSIFDEPTASYVNKIYKNCETDLFYEPRTIDLWP